MTEGRGGVRVQGAKGVKNVFKNWSMFFFEMVIQKLVDKLDDNACRIFWASIHEEVVRHIKYSLLFF